MIVCDVHGCLSRSCYSIETVGSKGSGAMLPLQMFNLFNIKDQVGCSGVGGGHERRTASRCSRSAFDDYDLHGFLSEYVRVVSYVVLCLRDFLKTW